MPLDAQDKITIDTLTNRFSYHPPFGTQPERYERLRAEAKALATLIVTLCPSSAERSTALTRLDEAIMHANAAIARNENAPE